MGKTERASSCFLKIENPKEHKKQESKREKKADLVLLRNSLAAALLIGAPGAINVFTDTAPISCLFAC